MTPRSKTVATPSSTIQATAQSWANQLLDIESPSDPAKKRSELLRLISQSDYVLSIDQANAAQRVTDVAPNGQTTLGREAISFWRYEQGLQVIADYKAVFFNLACDERSRRWELLAGQYADQPDLHSQLIQLKRGLKISMPADPPNSRQEYILRTCRNVFLGSPSTAAYLRRVFCNQWSADESWEDAIDEALEHYGDVLAGIAPWIDEFGNQRFWESQDAKLPRVLTKVIEAPVSQGEQLSVQPELKSREALPEPPIVHPSHPGDWWSIVWVGITAFVIVLTIVILLFDGTAQIPIDKRPLPRLPPLPYPRLR